MKTKMCPLGHNMEFTEDHGKQLLMKKLMGGVGWVKIQARDELMIIDKKL